MTGDWISRGVSSQLAAPSVFVRKSPAAAAVLRCAGMGTICAMAMVMWIAWVRAAAAQSPPASPGISSCRAVAGPAAGQLCTFPFTFAGSVRTSCIPDTDPEARLWCSTKVDTDQISTYVNSY